jgi:MOFRL family
VPKFAANLTMLFNELPFLDRFAAAKAAGFSGVEYLVPYDFGKAVLREKLQQHGLTQVLHNLPAGNWGAGERGIAIFPDRIDGGENNAGAILTPDMLRRAKRAGIDVKMRLADNDAYSVFAALNDLVVTGPTLTKSTISGPYWLQKRIEFASITKRENHRDAWTLQFVAGDDQVTVRRRRRYVPVEFQSWKPRGSQEAL